MMPVKAKATACVCGGVKVGGRCDRCGAASRTTAHRRGYGPRWQRASRLFLAKPENKECRECPQPATVTDHIIPHRGDPTLFWDVENWQPLCAACHNKKTNDGG